MARAVPILAIACAAAGAHARGFGQRFDLPLPLWLWLTGAGATIVLTFAALALFARQRDFGTAFLRSIVGHVLAVIVAHVEATRRFASHRSALLSQLPMLVLMMAYTSLSLWIMAQPIVG